MEQIIFNIDKRIRLIFILLLPWLSDVHSQKAITLKECYENARSVSALTSEIADYSEIWQLRDKNLSKGWLPSFDATGSLLYNSEVVDMKDILGSTPLGGIADAIKPLPNEQYRIYVDINQVIYDGGVIKNSRAIEKAELGINEKQTETDLYKIRGQVNGYFFNLLLLKKQKDMLLNYYQLITKKISSMKSALESGVVLRSDLDVMTSEKLRLEQDLKENEIRRLSLLELLSDVTGLEADTSTVFVLPDVSGILAGEITRPEIEMLDMRKEQLNISMNLIESKRMPRAFGFATLGYGNPPGNNFFKDEFAPYYVLGAGLKWNIFDWNRAANEKKVVAHQQNIIETRKTDLTNNLRRMLDAKSSEIKNLQALIETDSQLIELRKRITSSSESQYENGIITASEYLSEINRERQAVINHEIHMVNMVLAKVEYLNISGKEIE